MYTDKSGNSWYKVGLHIHTTLSDGKKSPEEVADIYKKAGFDAIAITDHWKYHDEDEINGLKIISGCEYNLGIADTIEGVMHIVGVGMKIEPVLTLQNSRQEVIDAIINAGGMAVLAHPHWSLNTIEDVKALSGFSMLEIYNTVSDVDQSTRPYSGYLVDVLANQGITFPLTATDDAHYYEADKDDVAKSYIMVNSKSNSTADILTAIKEEKFYATQGPELYIRKENDRIIADTSECVLIKFLSNSSFSRPSALRGEGLTHFEYTPKKWDKWVRAEVRDKDGNYAWSNIIIL